MRSGHSAATYQEKNSHILKKTTVQWSGQARKHTQDAEQSGGLACSREHRMHYSGSFWAEEMNI